MSTALNGTSKRVPYANAAQPLAVLAIQIMALLAALKRNHLVPTQLWKVAVTKYAKQAAGRGVPEVVITAFICQAQEVLAPEDR